MRWGDLIRDPKDGTASSTKLWTNIGFAVLSVAFLRHAWLHPLTFDLVMAYGAIVCANNIGVKWIAGKYGHDADAR